jgi:glycerate 2-kinase
MAVKVFSDTRCALGEGPIWAWDRLVWFDIEGRRLHARGRNGAETRWDFAEQASAAALLPDGFLLVAAETGLRILNAATGQHSRIAPLEAEQRTTRTNDARADRQGGFWIGTMGKTEADRAGNGAIWRFHGGMLRRLRTGVTIPNAICFAPDGRRAYFADSTRAQVYAWTLDTGGWPEGEPEVFLDLSGQGVAPDGAVVDAEGALWLALWDGGRLIRVLPDGRHRQGGRAAGQPPDLPGLRTLAGRPTRPALRHLRLHRPLGGSPRRRAARRLHLRAADRRARPARADGDHPVTPAVTPAETLRALFDAAVEAALPARILPPHLPDPPAGRTLVLGAGKASAAMAAALEAHWPGELTGLVITRYGHAVPCDRIEIVEAAHPVPDEAGAAAAERMLGLCAGLGADDLVIALISGGGSALMTLPPEGVTRAEIQALNRALLASGAPIGVMNAIRRHLSRINGGRLAAACHPARVLAMLISDVPGDDPVDIASGPTVPDPTTLADARALVARHHIDLPAAITSALDDPANESVKPGDPRLARAETRIIAAPMASLEAAAAKARDLGLAPRVLGDAIEGEARDVGADMARQALAARPAPGAPPVVLISGGETTVTLPRDTHDLGRGGRNVDFLLGLARALDSAPGIHAIACDTDGVDGAEEVAGAVVAPDTIARAGREALASALARHDGHGFFAALGDQVVTGPTLTNVNDFRAILIEA